MTCRFLSTNKRKLRGVNFQFRGTHQKTTNTATAKTRSKRKLVSIHNFSGATMGYISLGKRTLRWKNNQMTLKRRLLFWKRSCHVCSNEILKSWCLLLPGRRSNRVTTIHSDLIASSHHFPSFLQKKVQCKNAALALPPPPGKTSPAAVPSQSCHPNT